ncbi:SRPBCC domain-containing protein [Lederbergia wuyishanensis]|uniref:Uncharacterized protein YndB with AHSA1/START domain n=1 Tax=Lederbergia wuyishanensis TaxID=1347903 RepID=A0ABU0D0E0_9BACI|nr:SRPBCC domain-containing protein [Lederbergia wuyishanensis]MCJ8006494.1 SRPBCC domain-containing protein [Lederbergia wuyishanensis]MDQ0341870.1 uncharacterized protein YndB with AHSA1/START domain [Lederbergia wuyishanensis]
MADVSLDFQYKSSIDKVWNALTDSDMLAKWIWKNDFKPIVGHKFQFRSEPNEWWDGIVNGEVLEVNEPHTLSYIWESAGERTTITWTLTEDENGTTHLHMEQTGFSEATKARAGAIQGAKYAWTKNGEQLEKVLAEL